jgi:hypothetical protein
MEIEGELASEAAAAEAASMSAAANEDYLTNRCDSKT